MDRRLLDSETLVRLDPLNLRPEELDCEIKETLRGFCIEGYDKDALLNDFPPSDISIRKDCFDYVQQLCKLWHVRYSQQRACGCMETMGISGTEDRERVITIGIPHPKRYIDCHLPWIIAPAVVFTELAEITDQKTIQATSICVYGIDVTANKTDTEESGEEETYNLVVDHIGTYTFVEFIDSLVPYDDKPKGNSLLLSVWNLLNSSNSVEPSLLDWVSIACIDAGKYDPEQIEKEELRLQDLRKKRQRFEGSSKFRPVLGLWMPSPEQIPALERPRLPLVAYESGHVPRFTPIKQEAERFASAMGLGCFAYDFYKQNKRFLVCTWDSAWNIVARGYSYTIPSAGHALTECNRGRHLYEGMLPEFPQKLILDLEYYTKDNPDISTLEAIDAMTTLAIKFTSSVLSKMFNYTPSLEDWIVLDASDDAKASRHVILNSPWHFFRNMHDATFFRDIMKAFVEAGILFRDPDVMKLMICSEPKRDKSGKIMAASSIAEQVLIEDKWLSCFIDWNIVNHTFRLMRTYRATKFGQDHRPFVEATMNRQKYAQERDLFVNSLVSSVQPVDELVRKKEPGWKVSQTTMIDTLASIQSALAAAGFPAGSTSPAGQLDPKNHRRGKKRGRQGGVIRKGVSVAQSSFGSSNVNRSTSWIKKELDSKDVRHYGVSYIVSVVKEQLSVLISDTDYWRVWAVWDMADPHDSIETPRCFWFASANSKYCPIAGDNHSARGKMILQINRWGKLKAFCQAGRCNGRVWKLEDKRVSKKMLRVLWPKGFFKGGFMPAQDTPQEPRF